MQHSSAHDNHAGQARPLVAGRSGPLKGVVRVPGDKSISHRALMFSGLATGQAEIRGLLEAEDTLNTASAMRALGADVVRDGDVWRVKGRGVGGLTPPDGPLDFGNSGTGVFARATSQTGNTNGIRAEARSNQGTGIRAEATSTTGNTTGIIGQSASSSGTGILGRATSRSGDAVGIRGTTNAANGAGVVAEVGANAGDGAPIDVRILAWE